MATQYGYDLFNKRRDLTDALNTIIQQTPTTLSLFASGARPINQKHEWNENVLAPRRFTAVSVSAGAASTYDVVVSSTDYATLKAGMIVRMNDGVATWKVNTLTLGTLTANIGVEGNFATEIPLADDVFDIISMPQSEGTDNGDGEDVLYKNGNSYNYTQIFRKEIVMSASALASNQYGDFDNNLNSQTQAKLLELARDLAGGVYYGNRVEMTSLLKGQFGGMFFFSSLTDALGITKTGTPALTATIVNDAAEDIMAAGGMPSIVLCSVAQARNLSGEYAANLQVQIPDRTSGQYISQVANAVTGSPMRIMYDYLLPDSACFVLDPQGLERNDFRPTSDEDATTKGFDGIKRAIILETTFSFPNYNQRVCKVDGLGDPDPASV